MIGYIIGFGIAVFLWKIGGLLDIDEHTPIQQELIKMEDEE